MPLKSTPKVLKDARLVVPDTPRKTFYAIRLEECPDSGRFRVLKTSGAMGKVWDQRAWEFDTRDEAERFFCRRIKEKTDPGRNSPRRYSILCFSESIPPVRTAKRRMAPGC